MSPFRWANGGSVNVFLSMISVLWENAAVFGNGYGIQGQSYVALLQGNGMSAGFHYRNLILGM